MKDKSITYIIVVTILVLCLGSLFIYTNILGHSEKKNNEKNEVVKTTKKVKPETTTVVGDKINDIDNQSIIVNNEIVDLKLKEYVAILGFSVEYPYEYFNATKINTSTLALISNTDNNTFVKIELLSETQYYNEYNNGDNYLNISGTKKEGYSYEYKFFRGSDIYLKVTKCIKETETDLSKGPMMDYMINSINIE